MKNSSIKITPLSNTDYDSWLHLWQNYLTFYETSLPMSTTDTTWRNLLDSNIAIYGFGAWQDGTLVGITHVVLHPSTWTSNGCCYLQDLYVSESIRGQGVGRTLIEYVSDFATQKSCNHVYWKTQESNADARQLYDNVASLTDMVQYRKNL
ncbi:MULTISPECIES: GNAT family N-acetyltransferase [Psychrobacter]|uniref:Ribosomal protein S18 acetylase RimI-like enzyme n=1 Tax=Psychrobacter fozii TaxID=198480 RepID=A0A2V4ULH3_9GAMM|nr:MULTISPECIES: GNAT family N-acetyltransferase [Psychrobacter]MBH0064375.1 GNAT family N-acetyltransferase [Psychrobacter sp. SZ93C1]PYE39769.1 ribosomal protein S18 acetylase RimI-like enzyme [Psychrobacter fozii]